jgi:Na+/phosphate symporter
MTEITMQQATEMGSAMLKLLQRQHLFFQELRKLSESQRTLITAEQSEDLLSVLGKRQKLVLAIGELHQESSVYREKWPDFKDLLPNELREMIGKLLDELQQMLNAIIEQDQEDCQKLSAGKEQVGSALQQINQARTTRASYSSPAKQAYGQSSGGSIQFTG